VSVMPAFVVLCVFPFPCSARPFGTLHTTIVFIPTRLQPFGVMRCCMLIDRRFGCCEALSFLGGERLFRMGNVTVRNRVDSCVECHFSVE
jgi:hypothetical protein